MKNRWSKPQYEESDGGILVPSHKPLMPSRARLSSERGWWPCSCCAFDCTDGDSCFTSGDATTTDLAVTIPDLWTDNDCSTCDEIPGPYVLTYYSAPTSQSHLWQYFEVVDPGCSCLGFTVYFHVVFRLLCFANDCYADGRVIFNTSAAPTVVTEQRWSWRKVPVNPAATSWTLSPHSEAHNCNSCTANDALEDFPDLVFSVVP